jgi:FkbM family methyltransferase
MMRWCAARDELIGEWHLQTPGGQFSLPLGSDMTWRFAFEGAYDRSAQRFLSRYVTPGSLVLDVGASLGLWTVPLAQVARDAGASLWAFEPHPSNLPWLHRNIELNDLAVTVHPIALGDVRGELRMSPTDSMADRGGNAAVALGEHDDRSVRVPVRRLDDLPRSKRVSMVKLDVEGFELNALRGAAALLDSDRPVIFGEFEQPWLEARGEDLSGWVEDMRSRDYCIFSLNLERARPWMMAERIRLDSVPSGQIPRTELLLVPRERT